MSHLSVGKSCTFSAPKQCTHLDPHIKEERTFGTGLVNEKAEPESRTSYNKAEPSTLLYVWNTVTGRKDTDESSDEEEVQEDPESGVPARSLPLLCSSSKEVLTNTKKIDVDSSNVDPSKPAEVEVEEPSTRPYEGGGGPVVGMSDYSEDKHPEASHEVGSEAALKVSSEASEDILPEASHEVSSGADLKASSDAFKYIRPEASHEVSNEADLKASFELELLRSDMASLKSQTDSFRDELKAENAEIKRLLLQVIGKNGSDP